MGDDAIGFALYWCDRTGRWTVSDVKRISAARGGDCAWERAYKRGSSSDLFGTGQWELFLNGQWRTLSGVRVDCFSGRDCAGGWTPWSACALDAEGNGTQSRVYNVFATTLGAGADCTEEGGTEEARACNPCDAPWSAWGACEAECTRSRGRTSADCAETEVENCTSAPCRLDCIFEWVRSECSAHCNATE